MGTYNRFQIALKKGKGCFVWDNDGRKYMDFTSGIAVTSLGHSNDDINKVISEQINNLIHVSNLFYIEQQAVLARHLVENSFADRVFFCNSGTEAMEAAIKLARKWGHENEKKYKIISTHGSFHGRSYGALSATGNQKHQLGFAPLLEGFLFVPYGEIEAIRELASDNDVCAVMVEPVQGENGVILPPENYLENLRELCDEFNMLLILDEIQVGLGRTGKLFAYQHNGIEPDIMALAKSIASGIPCGALLAKDQIAESFTPGSHGSTFGGNPLAMSCAIKVFETVNDKDFLANVTKLGNYFFENLRNLTSDYTGIVKEIRAKGLILGIEYNESEIAKKVTEYLIKNGLLTILTAGKVTRILPPLNVTRDEIDQSLAIFNKSFKEAMS